MYFDVVRSSGKLKGALFHSVILVIFLPRVILCVISCSRHVRKTWSTCITRSVWTTSYRLSSDPSERCRSGCTSTTTASSWKSFALKTFCPLITTVSWTTTVRLKFALLHPTIQLVPTYAGSRNVQNIMIKRMDQNYTERVLPCITYTYLLQISWFKIGSFRQRSSF